MKENSPWAPTLDYTTKENLFRIVGDIRTNSPDDPAEVAIRA